MSYHIVSIDAANCSLSCRDGQLTCRTAEGERRLPLEDVASIIVTSWSAQIHSHLFLQAAKQGVALILCESFKPTSIVLPANRSTDTLLSRALLRLTPRVRADLWQKTVDAKCGNQLALAQHLAPTHPALEALQRVAAGQHTHKEALCARTFWKIMGGVMGDSGFTRRREGGGLNALLNYGYAVLLSTVLQKLFGVGLDPTWGIAHAPRERATPLAYDLMEPFRPCVDARVVQWVRDHPTPDGQTVTPAYRHWAAALPLQHTLHRGHSMEMHTAIETVVRSFRHAVREGRARYYQPWTPSDIKWAG